MLDRLNFQIRGPYPELINYVVCRLLTRCTKFDVQNKWIETDRQTDRCFILLIYGRTCGPCLHRKDLGADLLKPPDTNYRISSIRTPGRLLEIFWKRVTEFTVTRE